MVISKNSNFESEDFSLVLESKNDHPHHFLGLHSLGDKQVIRMYKPGAEEVYLEVLGERVKATQIHKEGLFIYYPRKKIGREDYRIFHQNGLLAHDPYAFDETCSDMDVFLFKKGVHYELYSMLGAHVAMHQGVLGTKFAVWAPNASSVSLVGDFNYWDGRFLPMRNAHFSGVWEIFVPGIGQGERYKYEIRTKEGFLRVKSDPHAFYSEVRPNTASVVFDVDTFSWEDESWRQTQGKDFSSPMNVYEVHLGSWKKNHEGFPSYREVASELAVYCNEMGFTHVELLPILEHPLDESWGYQVSGFYASTSRFGTPEDFQYFVNTMHKHGIGVLLDWVPAHFPTDDFSLNRFDGTALYEHEDPKKGMHPHWNTMIFNYERLEVANFLIGSALFWLDKMHIDGLRVDAVASMLYLDYGRKEGEWIPNQYGGNYNLEAIEFIKHLNSIVHERFPQALMIAEESTSFLGVTHPLEKGGLGFDYKWNMGWMNDTLSYFKTDPFYRKHHQKSLTFSILYAFSEKYILALSHDEVVHCKKSLLEKMPGDEWQRMANLRLLYSYMICHPGKKTIFMGGEIGQFREWNCKGQLDWDLLNYPIHLNYQHFVRDLNRFYLQRKELWENELSYDGFEWVDFSDELNCVISYLRKGKSSTLFCIHNFTPQFKEEYLVPLRNVQMIKEVFTSDDEQYGGSGKKNHVVSILRDERGWGTHVSLSLSPLSTMIFEVRF